MEKKPQARREYKKKHKQGDMGICRECGKKFTKIGKFNLYCTKCNDKINEIGNHNRY